jgi:hypothetical protein
LKILAALAMLATTAPAVAETADLTKDAQFQREVRQRFEMNGKNCPIPLTYSSVGEDGRGKLYKVECLSSDGTKGWAFRIISPPKHLSIIEPW